jgi:oxygen-independent coproporphyrinogen III oxidase
MISRGEHHVGLYVHIPFCARKCPYCDFYSSPDTGRIGAFLDALEREARLYAGSFKQFATLYLGGGTPSLLPPAAFERLMNMLGRCFSFAASAEMTLEANPNDITSEILRVYRDAGINRLSLGVQSFDDAVLAGLGRRHSARQARESITRIRRAGFDNLNLDLMYAVPGQTAAQWETALNQALVCAPDHLSCYELTIKKGTLLYYLQRRGQLPAISEKVQHDFFLAASAFLTRRGYTHYEVSNYARRADRCSTHNRLYWEHRPYLGLGPSAHSFCGGKRWWNIDSLERYCGMLSGGAAPVAGAETPDADGLRLETLMLGFRTRAGIPLAALRRSSVDDGVLNSLTRSGLVRIRGRRVCPTPRGMLLADSLPLLFT